VTVQLTHQQYDALEQAVRNRERIAAFRRGTEYIVVPEALTMRDGREIIRARNPTTGEPMDLALDELDDLHLIHGR
jgi:hypothetical protein